MTCDAVDVERIERMLDRWRAAAEYAKNQGKIQEYDGIMGCVDEVEDMIEKCSDRVRLVSIEELAESTGQSEEQLEKDRNAMLGAQRASKGGRRDE